MLRAVLDTNVLVAGLRSRGGASAAILELVRQRRRVQPVVSLALVYEYEAVLKRPGMIPHWETSDVDVFLRGFVARAVRVSAVIRRRPLLSDPDDDKLVELALPAAVRDVVTANVRHLAPATALGLRVLTPGEFLAGLPFDP